MFDLFSLSHIIILLTVALLVVGPKDLPRIMRTAGAWVRSARSMAAEFQNSFDEMARQSELDELRKEIGALRIDRPDGVIAQPIQKDISTIVPLRDDPPIDEPGADGETASPGAKAPSL